MKVMSWNLVEASEFFSGLLCNCSSCFTTAKITFTSTFGQVISISHPPSLFFVQFGIYHWCYAYVVVFHRTWWIHACLWRRSCLQMHKWEDSILQCSSLPGKQVTDWKSRWYIWAHVRICILSLFFLVSAFAKLKSFLQGPSREMHIRHSLLKRICGVPKLAKTINDYWYL